jgi:glycosyltransferase involved in cell wall biosynthesis
MKPTLCIITPVYNGARYLEACVRNVAGQWTEGIVHWVLDGGSKDGSIEILTRLSEEFSHLKWISEPDKGQSDAMNKGLRKAENSWIGFLNVDDFYEPGILPKVVKRIQVAQDPDAFWMGNLNVRDGNDHLLSVNQPRNMRLSFMLADMCEWPFNPSAYFYPARLHATIGFFPEGEHYAMDYDFMFRLLFSNWPIRYFDETWGNFRLLADAKTGQDQVGNQSYRRAEAIRQDYLKKASLTLRAEVSLLRAFWAVRNKCLSLIRKFSS